MRRRLSIFADTVLLALMPAPLHHLLMMATVIAAVPTAT
jgi:hypothetical protein